MLKLNRLILLFLLSFMTLTLVSGCGFHLRGTTNAYVLPFSQIRLTPDDPFNLVYKPLRYALEAKNIKVFSVGENNAKNIYCFEILESEFSTQPFAYGPDGEIRREKLIFELNYEYQGKKGKATARRFRQLNLDQNLADEAEKVMLQKEMINDTIQQVLLQLMAQ